MKSFIFSLIILASSLIACDNYTPAVVVVKEQKLSREENGQLRLTVTVENTGGVPARFVIVQAKAMVKGEEAEFHEKEFGDLNPGGQITDYLLFSSFPFSEPDKFEIRIIYNE